MIYEEDGCFRKEMRQVIVSVTPAGDVSLVQSSLCDEDAYVEISYAQIDVVCNWLQQAKRAIAERCPGVEIGSSMEESHV